MQIFAAIEVHRRRLFARHRFSAAVGCALALLCAMPAQAGPKTFAVDINTEVFAGIRSGVMLVEIVSGGSARAGDAASLVVTGVDVAFADLAPTYANDVSGDARTMVTFGNAQGTHSIRQEFVFGPRFQFILAVDPDMLRGGAVHFSFRRPDNDSPLLSIEDHGRLISFTVGQDGAVQWEAFGPAEDVRQGQSPEEVPTNTTLASSANPSTPGAPVTLTARISSASATRTVRFTSNDTPIRNCDALSVIEGAATCTTTFASAGPFTIGAAYEGDLRHSGSTAAPLTQQVDASATTTALSATPNPAKVGERVRLSVTVTPAIATGTVTFQEGVESLGIGLIAGGIATFTTSALPEGTHTITAAYSGDTVFAASVSGPVTVTVSPEPTEPTAPVYTQYFAEGATGFFQTDIGIVNASKTEPADVRVTFFPESGSSIQLEFTLGALGRRTLDLNALIPGVQAVSTRVESNRPVAATRTMTWGEPIYGSTLESGIISPAATWYFAEGATGSFNLFYLLQNPGNTPVQVTLTHLLEGGAPAVTQRELVPAAARRTVSVNDAPGAAAAMLSTVVTSDAPIVVERTMYASGARTWEGGASGRGAAALSTRWSFAEGATGFFQTYLLLGNPLEGAARVTVTYQLPDGTVITRPHDVKGQSRFTIDVATEDERLAATPVSVTATSDAPIVAERAMWWGAPWYEGSVSLGSTETGTVWAIGEGAEGGVTGESTFVLVSNGTSTAGRVLVTVAFDDGSRQEKEYALAANARLTTRVLDDFANAEGRRFSVVVESVTKDMPITVEYARYQSASRFGDAGGTALATRVQ